MARDRIRAVGKNIEKFQNETRDYTRYASKTYPSVETSVDLIGTLYTYTLEFKLYGGQSAYLDLTFLPKFKPIGVV